jgi:hypothetical protein
VTLGLAAFAPGLQAVHLDVELRGGNDKVDIGFCMTAGVGCDLPGALKQLGLPDGTLPIDWATGRMMFAADLDDFPRPNETANPGFQAVGGALIPQELIRYEALDGLQYWDPDQRIWRPSDATTQIRLFGGLEARTIIREDRSHCEGLLICIPKEIIETVYDEGSTTYQASGIGNASSLIVDNANASGAFHTHLDWFLENTAGEAGGPRGAYLVAMRLWSDRRSQPSEPFLIAFNNGLPAQEFVAALSARMEDPTIVDPTPEPRAFSAFQYLERAAEKLSCKPTCIEGVRGSTEVDIELTLDQSLSADTVADARSIHFGIGTRTLVAKTPSNKLLFDNGTARGSFPVRDASNGRIGTLSLEWNSSRLNLAYRLKRALFSGEFLESGGLSRTRRIESVTLTLKNRANEILAIAQGTLTVDLRPNRIKTRESTRDGVSYELSRLTTKGGYQP